MSTADLLKRRLITLLMPLTTALLLVGILGVPATSFAQGVKIGYVDLQRALNEVKDGKQAKKKLKAEFKDKQKKLNEKQEAVKKLKEDIEANAMMLSEDGKRQKAMEFQRAMMELQRLYYELQNDLSKKEAEATRKIFDKMATIINQIGKEKKLTMILERTESSVLYAEEGLDLTDELIKRYDKK